MKKILLIEAGLKPGWTRKFADELEALLRRKGGFEVRRATLRDMRIEPCCGCGVCLERGEARCRNHDDDALAVVDELLCADGIVTLTPNYSLQTSALFKTLATGWRSFSTGPGCLAAALWPSWCRAYTAAKRWYRTLTT